MHDIIERLLFQARNSPNNIAVYENDQNFTYKELIEFSFRFAANIIQKEKFPKVAILLSQGINAYASMIAVLLVGGYYCPINISLTKFRKKQILNEFVPNIVITDEYGLNLIEELQFDTIILTPTDLNNDRFDDLTKLNELAYVIFTSGSTGIPKGVMIKRSAISNFIDWAIKVTKISPGDRWGQFSNLGFDLSIMDIYTCLIGGGTLIPISKPVDRLMPALAIKKYGITIWHSVPSVIDLMSKANQITKTNLTSLRLMSFCGEPLMPQHLKILFEANQGLEIFNTYGPTETTVFCQ